MLRTIALLAALVPLVASADPGDGRERATNHAERADDRRDLAGDQVDRARLASLVDEWHSAWESGDTGAERAADEGIARWIRQEIGESRHEVTEAQREVARSQAEAARSGREFRSSVGDGRRRATADDARDRADDQRDLRDDRGDARAEQADLAATVIIAHQLKKLQPEFTSGRAGQGEYREKSSLLRDLQALARAEVRRDQGELEEDRAETREDRRERRESRRGR